MILLEFIGSMNLAITLLVMVAIASVIGTVLKQNEAYENYIIKFGSFWFEVYKALGLYDVYSAGWFLLILGFLLISTSVCVYRNGPGMLRDMRSFRENAGEKSLRSLPNSTQWSIARESGAVAGAVTRHLTSYGYRLRTKQHAGHTVLAAMKGSANRLGYLFTHIAIVVICIGGLLDGNMPLKIAEAMGKVRVETRSLNASQVPAISRLQVGNSSFRGLVSIPEGSVAKHVDVRVRDGYLLQELPFSVEVKDFRIEHYDSGQPKSFESDLIIYDKDLVRPLRKTIAVNHPLTYKGYSIYQANFGDGGSKLRMRAWPLATPGAPPIETNAPVSKKLKLDSPQGPLTVELEDFRFYNVKPAPPESGKAFRDLGPSFIFKVRDVGGTAREYENYMMPIEQNGRLFLVSGMRDNPNEEYSYLQIPADPKGGIERFMGFLAVLHDKQKVEQVVAQVTRESLRGGPGEQQPKVQQGLAAVMTRLLEIFNQGGFDAVARYFQTNLPKDQLKEVATAYVDLLQKALTLLYADVLAQEATQVATGAAEQENRQFFEDAVNAMGVIPQYGSFYYLQLTDFDHIQASGLQITRAPGKNVVYLGFGMLIIGVFLMFYLPHRRLWVLLRQDGAATQVLFAGASHRDQIGFNKEFNTLQYSLEGRLKEL